MTSNELEIQRSRRDGEPLTVDGQIVGAGVDLSDMIARSLLRRGLDPELVERELSRPEPVQDPRGNVMDRAEASAWHTEQALRALSHYADGEFDFDRLPEVNEYVKMWIEEHKKDPQAAPTLVLQGTTGCGKTSQCFCLLKELVLWYAERGERFAWYFITHRNFAAAVQPGSGRDPDALMHRLMTADLVVVDDLGDFNSQDWGKAADYTSRLINHRAHHRLPTVYDTNSPFTRTPEIQAAEQVHGRIAVLADTLDSRALSRLGGGWTVVMPEVDYRMLAGRRFGG